MGVGKVDVVVDIITRNRDGPGFALEDHTVGGGVGDGPPVTVMDKHTAAGDQVPVIGPGLYLVTDIEGTVEAGEVAEFTAGHPQALNMTVESVDGFV